MSQPQHRTPRMAVGLTALLAAVAFGGLSHAANAPAGEVSYVSGSALRRAPAEKPRDVRLKKGSPVFQGDELRTGKGARLEIRLADGSALRLGPEGKLVLSEADFTESKEERKVSVKLLLGRVWSKVSSAVGGDSKFEVTTENAVAGVRGTTFRVSAAQDQSTLVRVYSGTVAVAGSAPIYQQHQPGEKRQQVAGPSQVSQDQWERMVGQMMSVKIGADGRPSEVEQFALEDELAGDEKAWVAWNRERDGSE